MRSRIVVFVVLSVVTALVGVYVGWSTNTPKAVGEPATATPADSSVGPTQRRGSGSGPARSPTASLPQAGPPKAGANPGGNATQPGQPPATPPASPPPPSTGPVRFGKVAITPSNNTVDTNIAPDRRALTTGFSDREVQVGVNVTESDATRSFAMTLPLTDGAKGKTIWVHAQGFAFTEEGTSARLTLRLNGLVTVKDFPAGSDSSYVHSLRLPAIPATTYQLSGVVEVQQDPGTNASAYLNVLSIDIGIG